MPLVPYVVEDTPRGERGYDIFSRLLKDRIVFIMEPITDPLVATITAQLLFLEKEDPDRDIDLYINSPGGSVTAGKAIYDAMQIVKPDVATTCVGMAASAAAFLLCSGAAGKRYATPYARIMIHQPLGGAEGQATDLEIMAREILYHKRSLNEIMAKHTGQTLEKIQQDTERDFFMSAEEAKAYGIVDEVLNREMR